MKVQYNDKITEADFPSQAGFTTRFISNFSQMALQIYQAINGNLSLSDNLNGAKLTLPLTHGVPYLLASPLQSRQRPMGIDTLACDTQSVPSVSISTSATVNGVITVAPTGYVFLTALYPITITDWVSYTPTGSWTTNTTYTGKWRRVGDTLEAMVDMSLAGAPNAATLTNVFIPSGLVIDTSKINQTAAVRQILGDGLVESAGVGNWRLSIDYMSTTSVRPVYFTAAANDAGITATVPGTFKAADYLNFWFRVPIVGWGITGTTANVTLFAWGG